MTATEARQLTEDADWEAIAAWCGGTLHNVRDITDEYTTELRIGDGPTPMLGWVDDWVIRVGGRFVVTPPDAHYRLPGDRSGRFVCGRFDDDEDTPRVDEAGTGTCPGCRAAAGEDPLR